MGSEDTGDGITRTIKYSNQHRREVNARPSQDRKHQEATLDRRYSGKAPNPVTSRNAKPGLDSKDDRVCAESGRANISHHENDRDGCIRADTRRSQTDKIAENHRG